MKCNAQVMCFSNLSFFSHSSIVVIIIIPQSIAVTAAYRLCFQCPREVEGFFITCKESGGVLVSTIGAKLQAQILVRIVDVKIQTQIFVVQLALRYTLGPLFV
jgi:hypothetical protein